MEQWCLFLTRFQICLVATHGSASFFILFFSIAKKKTISYSRDVMAKMKLQGQKKKKKSTVYFQLAPEPGS